MVNNELEAYNPSQVSSDGRHLNLVAKYVGGTPGSSGAYVSGRMNSGNKAYYQNGAWSAQVRYTQDHAAHYGAWPAVWLLGNAIANGTCWPAYGAREIDFMEWMFVNNWADSGEPSTAGYDGNAIWGSGCGISDMLTNHLGNPDGNFNPNDWAIFKVTFDENVGTGGPQIHFYVNGNLQASGAMDQFYNQPMFPIINLAIGGGPLGAVNGDASGFNNTSQWAKLSVDWIAHEKWCTAAQMAAGGC
jgi:beta-glucanase (GH16 family)